MFGTCQQGHSGFIGNPWFLTKNKEDAKGAYENIYSSNIGVGDPTNTKGNIFTHWARRGSYGDFDFRTTTAENDYLEVKDKSITSCNPDFLPCYEVYGKVDN